MVFPLEENGIFNTDNFMNPFEVLHFANQGVGVVEQTSNREAASGLLSVWEIHDASKEHGLMVHMDEPA